jgi:hypothetical protein
LQLKGQLFYSRRNRRKGKPAALKDNPVLGTDEVLKIAGETEASAAKK